MTPADRVAELHRLDRCDHDIPMARPCPACDPASLYRSTSQAGRAVLRAAVAFGNGARVNLDDTAYALLAELHEGGYCLADGTLTLQGQAAAYLLAAIVRGEIAEPTR